jgi:hypothetical protein
MSETGGFNGVVSTKSHENADPNTPYEHRKFKESVGYLERSI